MLGATHVLDRALPSPALSAKIAPIAGGAPIELVYDAVSHADTQALGYEVLAPGGTLVTTLPTAVPADAQTADKRIVNVFGSFGLPANRPLGVEVCRRLTEWLRTGAIVVRLDSRCYVVVGREMRWLTGVLYSMQPNEVEVVPGGLAGVAEGLERLKQNKVSGKKLVVRPQETL